MTDSGTRRGAANFAPVLMILSFVLMIGFLVWLGMTSEGTDEVALMENDTTTAEQPDTMELGAMGVTAQELRLNPEQYEGERVRIGSSVASAVGSQAFFLDLPQSPFLVKMDSSLVAEGRQIPQGEIVVTGTLLAMNDSIVDAWSETGSISQGDRPLVEFATHFIEASRIRAGRDTAPPASDTAANGGGTDAQQN